MALVPGTNGEKLSPTQIYQLAVQAGFSITDAVTATAIAMAESGGQTNVINSIGATGLWQIYDGQQVADPSSARARALSDPLTNAREAYAKYVASQKTSCGGWWPWASYDEGPCAARQEQGRNNTWRQFLGMAQAAATGVDIAGGGGTLVVPGGAGGSEGSAAGADMQAGNASQALDTGGAGGGQQRTLSLGSFGPWNIGVGTGVLWSVLFLGGAIFLVGLGVYLYFHEQINTAVGRAAETAAIAA
jgi:hypothetical protein